MTELDFLDRLGDMDPKFVEEAAGKPASKSRPAWRKGAVAAAAVLLIIAGLTLGSRFFGGRQPDEAETNRTPAAEGSAVLHWDPMTIAEGSLPARTEADTEAPSSEQIPASAQGESDSYTEPPISLIIRSGSELQDFLTKPAEEIIGTVYPVYDERDYLQYVFWLSELPVPESESWQFGQMQIYPDSKSIITTFLTEGEAFYTVSVSMLEMTDPQELLQEIRQKKGGRLEKLEHPEMEDLYFCCSDQAAAGSENNVFYQFYGIIQGRFFAFSSVKASLEDAMKTVQSLHFTHYEISEPLLEQARNRKTDAQVIMEMADCIAEAVYVGRSEDGSLLLFEPKQIWKGTLKTEEQTLLYVRAQFQQNYDGKQLLPEDLKPGLRCLLTLSKAYFTVSDQIMGRKYYSVGSISEEDDAWTQYISWAKKAALP